MKLKIMVTGGCGFIGQEFVAQFYNFARNSKIDFEILVIDKLTYASNKSLPREYRKFPEIKFIRKDINKLKTLYGCQLIYNFAAESHVDNSIKSSDEFIKSNINGVHRLLKLAIKERPKLFVQISTDEVLGERLRGEGTVYDELKPSNPYSASKASAEMLCRGFARTYNLPVLITRSCNNFGINQFSEKFIPNSIYGLIKNKKIRIYGDGKNIREWISVTDNCNSIIDYSLYIFLKLDKDKNFLKIVKSKEKNGIFRGDNLAMINIGTGYRLKNIDVAKKIISVFGYGKLEFVEDRKGHDRRYALKSNIRKIKDTDKKLEELILEYYRRTK